MKTITVIQQIIKCVLQTFIEKLRKANLRSVL